ncbi:T9SS type A sorting domain-containing protein [Pseudoflavitalea sp. G-6-1-2]|uniref:T9SS type A sorting domain-containing protein n=1 Tax=Pseudoflavitalea sp. G-6-1-2 TaxID=2728841 RepID=UPI00146D8E49|nr:T9SS type A sorting domain-containing protein [Pseudoflavitalea sp. G-6-1-2]NML19586.1 T9SS type A sorting domain-containing protein [Pseudoflavitalea sp. G-6-1-2]
MKHQLLFCLAAVLLICGRLSAQVKTTANNTVPAYNGKFMYGTNGGYYGSSWDDKTIADIAAGNPAQKVKGVGSKTFRPPLPENFLESWSYDIRVAEFKHYASLGVLDNTVFLGEPSAAHKDNNKYAGCADESKLFKNMYEPIWDGGANGTPVNDNNYYALYVYKTVMLYKNYVKFWEIVNEPDYDNAGNGWKKKGEAGNWWENNPPPCDLPNMKAPIFHYIRMLRISYEVIKSVDPTAYVTTGGLGYISFLDAILRNTDNPANGAVSTDYPLKGGAYFDVLSYHSYPMFNLATWSDANGGGWVYKRHSDAAVSEYVQLKKNFEAVLATYGYNGTTYPKKLFICTENNIPKKSFSNMIGSPDAQRNYMIKALVLSQKNDIRQYYTFVLGDSKTLAEATDGFQTMGLYQKLEGAGPRTNGGVYKQQYNPEGIAFKTTSDLLRGAVYDATKTTAMNLPANVDGAAFKDSKGEYTYVLWAKTSADNSESANATYSFPSAMNVGPKFNKREWNFTESNVTTTTSSAGIALTGTPIFLSGSFQVLPIPEQPGNRPDPAHEVGFRLFPNPTRDITKMRFTLSEPATVKVTIYAADGKYIGMPIGSKAYTRGTYTVPLELTQRLASGTYICRFEADFFIITEKLVIGR